MEVSDQIALGVGVALLALGWILYFVGVWLTGAVLAGAIAVGAGVLVVGQTDFAPEVEGAAVGVIALLGAIVGGWGMHLVHKVGFFAIGFCGGIAGGWFGIEPLRGLELDQLAFLDSPAGIALWATGAGLVLAILAVVLDWLVIAVITSGVGALLVSRALGLENEPAAGLMAGGVLLQSVLSLWLRRKGEKSEEDED